MSALLALEPSSRVPMAKVPGDLVAGGPPESRGLARDGVRLLVASSGAGTVEHARFRDLPRYLDPGDLLVVNTSATIPAAVPALDGRLLHLSTRLPGGAWVVEVRRPLGDGSAAELGARPGERLALPGGGGGELLAGYPLDRPHPDGVRLWLAALRLPQPLLRYLGRHGRPIRYAYTCGAWPLSDYQSVFATEPGSAEMPSAGRGFTPERGVRAVDALLTGWHAPEASHLALLEAVAGQEILRASYAAALAERYLWHEFGDLHLLLP